MSDIKFRLGLDGKPFEDGLNQAHAKAQGFSRSLDEVGGKIHRVFGLGHVFKGLLQGLGIGSIEKVIEFITEGFKSAAESAKEIAEYSDRALSAVLKLVNLHRTDEQKLAALQHEQHRDKVELANAQNDVAFHMGPDDAAKTAAELDAKIKERAVEIDELQTKIDNEAKKRVQELKAEQEKLAEAKLETARAGMTDEEKLVSLQRERTKYGLASLESKKTELERTQALVKEEETLKQIAELKKKIEEDAAAAAKKAAAELERQRKEAERLAKSLERAQEHQRDTVSALKEAKEQQFAFTLGDAAAHSRGSPAAQSKARLIAQKTKQLDQIADRGDYDVVFGDNGPTLVPRGGGNSDAARQATGRFRKLFNDRESLRGSISNLATADKSPFKQEIKAVETATKEVKEVLEEIRDNKFANE
jgi:hypothetical protein